MQTYEFEAYTADEEEGVSMHPVETLRVPCWNEQAAKMVARDLVKRHGGPCDVARAGPSPWRDRYFTTARPAYPFTKSKAVAFERLD